MALVQVELDDGTVHKVGESFAKSKGLKIIEDDQAEPDTDLGPTGLVRAQLADGTAVSVGASFAESKGLTVLEDEPATQHGRSIPATNAASLRGKALNQALTDAGLDTGGNLAERQARLAAHQTSGATVGGTNPVGQTDA